MSAPASLAAARPRRRASPRTAKKDAPAQEPTEEEALCAAHEKHDRPVLMDTESDCSDEWNDGSESSGDGEWPPRRPSYERRPATSSGGGKAKRSWKGVFRKAVAAMLLILSASTTAGGALPISRPCNDTFKLPSGEIVPLETPLPQLREWWAESQDLVREMSVLVDGFNKTHGREEVVLSLPCVETLGDLLEVERWIVMNYDVWYQHCVDLMTNEGNVSASQALSGFWHMCADLDIITRDSAEAIAAGHKVMDVFCLAQMTKRDGVDIEHEGEFARLCCGNEGAKKLLGLHHKRCMLLLKIQAAAFGKPCAAVGFGENARAFLGFLERLGFVENLGGVMHPSCWQLLQCDIAARLAEGKPVPGGLDREKHFLGADVAFGAVIKHAGEALLKPVDYWTNLWDGKADALEAVKKAWKKAMRDVHQRQRERATARFIDLETADFAAGGEGDWWVGYEKRYGPSRFFGVTMQNGRWRVLLTVEGKKVYVGRCDDEEDAARLVNILLVVLRREAPKNFSESFVDFLGTGGHGDAPADLVAAALRRVGRVDVKRVKSGDAAEALAAASSAQEKIVATRYDPRTRDDYFTFLSDLDVPGTEWMVDLADLMEEEGIETVGDLARVDVNNRELAMALTGAGTYCNGRKTLWRWKGAAAALLEVELADYPPPLLRKLAERTTKEQDALDVAARWVAHAGTPDPAFVKKYAEALADIARDVAEPQKKKKRRR